MAYNGWANYETWNVMLHMDNDETAYNGYRSAVADARTTKTKFNGPEAKQVVVAHFGTKTPDNVNLNSPKIRWGAIAQAMRVK